MSQCRHDLTAAWQLLREMHYSNEVFAPDWQAEHRYRYMGGLEIFAVITGEDVATVRRHVQAELDGTNDQAAESADGDAPAPTARQRMPGPSLARRRPARRQPS